MKIAFIFERDFHLQLLIPHTTKTYFDLYSATSGFNIASIKWYLILP
jgi:hypothetical protein